MADRIVVVTTSSVIKLDNKFKVMKTIPLEQVSNIFVVVVIFKLKIFYLNFPGVRCQTLL